MASIRILVVDDHKDWRKLVRLQLLIRPEWQVIGEASDGPEAIQKVRELRPDIIVLDIGLPSLNGIEAAGLIRQLSPQSKIIFLSMEDSLDTVHAALKTGARGYVYKADAQNDLLSAIEAVLAGKQFVSRRLEGHKLTDAQGTKTHRHEALFYSDDTVFLESLTNFIAAALAAGDVAVAIATEPHRDRLARRLEAQGVDIDAALREGTYIPLDVAETLSKFMANGMPDPVRFFEVVGGFIEVAAKAGKGKNPRVAACGECAPLLWAKGEVSAAIRLEQLWDQLVTIHQVDTLCAYASASFDGQKDEEVYERICAEHSAIFRI